MSRTTSLAAIVGTSLSETFYIADIAHVFVPFELISSPKSPWVCFYGTDGVHAYCKGKTYDNYLRTDGHRGTHTWKERTPSAHRLPLVVRSHRVVTGGPAIQAAG
jgi:hypothetical protein